MRQKQRASTLLEVLLSALLMLSLLALGMDALRRFWQYDQAAQQSMAQVREGQWVLQQMVRAVRNAGFGPLLVAATQADSQVPWNAYLQSYDEPVLWCPYGLVAASSAEASCALSGSGHPTLVVRTLADADSAPTTSDGRVQDCLGNGVPSAGLSYVEMRFSWRSATQQLYCQGNGRTDANANWLSAQPIFDKVTALRVHFLRDSDGDQRIDHDSEPTPSFNAWETVRAVRICVETTASRSDLSSPQVYIDCDDRWQTAPIGQARMVLQQTVAVKQ